MLQGRVCRQNRVVGLDNRARQLWRGVYAKLKLRLLAVVGREALQQERTETRTSSTTKRVENEEALQTRAVVCQTAELIHYRIDKLLTDSVMSTSICARRVRIVTTERAFREQHVQLFAASSFPLIMDSGWKSDRYGPVFTSSMAPGSRST